MLEDGGVSTGVLTPIEVLTETDKAQSVASALGAVDGIDTAVVPTGEGADSGGRTVVVLVPGGETVNSQSVDVVRRVKDVADGTDGVIGVAGLGADQVDFLHAVYGNLPLMLGLISLLTYILLVRAFRSLLLPLKAVLLNLVSLAAVFGAMVLFWQEGYGSNAVFGIAETGAVTFWIPIMVFAFLYGLSMDYEVFILSRVREEYDAGASTDQAVDPRHRPHRSTGHQRRADPLPGVRGPRLGTGHRHQGAGHRSGHRHPAGRHHHPLAAGAVAGLAVRVLELEAARRASPGCCGSRRRWCTPRAGDRRLTPRPSLAPSVRPGHSVPTSSTDLRLPLPTAVG